MKKTSPKDFSMNILIAVFFQILYIQSVKTLPAQNPVFLTAVSPFSITKFEEKSSLFETDARILQTLDNFDASESRNASKLIEQKISVFGITENIPYQKVSDSFGYPNIFVQRTQSLFSFTVYNYADQPFSSQINAQMASPILDGQPRDFSYSVGNEGNSTCIIFPLKPETGNLRLSIQPDCLFPVSVITKKFPGYAFNKNQFTVEADLFGAANFSAPVSSINVPFLDPSNQFTKLFLAPNFDFEKISSANSEFFLSVYCPLFKNPEAKKLQFTLTASERNNTKSQTIGQFQALLNGISGIFVPFKGSTILSFPLISEEVKVYFNSSANSNIIYDIQIEGKITQNTGNEFILAQGTTPLVTVSNKGDLSVSLSLYSQRVSERNNLGLILGVIFGVIGLFILGVLLFFILNKCLPRITKKRRSANEIKIKAENTIDERKNSPLDYFRIETTGKDNLYLGFSNVTTEGDQKLEQIKKTEGNAAENEFVVRE